jgi:dihydrofolate reductase
MIAAVAHHRIIGKDNRLPWHLPADLRHFRLTTLGKTVVMGRKTWDSIGKPLAERRNIVLSRNLQSLDGAEVWRDTSAISALAEQESEVCIIGGASLYRLFMPQAQRLYLTFVELDVAGDTWFPEWDAQHWREVERDSFAPDEKNPCAYHFTRWERQT